MSPLCSSFNVLMEISSAVAMFYLVRLWITRIRRKRWNNIVEDLADALPSERLCLWFIPACMLNSHGWPQWDIWIVPFFIFAALSASCSRWMLCGLLLGTAAFLKGQILIVAVFSRSGPAFPKAAWPGCVSPLGRRFRRRCQPMAAEGIRPLRLVIVDALLLAPIIWLTWKSSPRPHGPSSARSASWFLSAGISKARSPG